MIQTVDMYIHYNNKQIFGYLFKFEKMQASTA